ncbi:adenine deaminase [Methanoregula sp.]|uniref:adenine deaminase n=1 Tax=Methanoregula sp. TaxID=2052170 RepID=UPI00356B2BC5
MMPVTKDLIEAARGLIPADTVFKNARVFNPFTCVWEKGDLAVKDGRVLGIGDYAGSVERDFSGLYIVPGLIDAHVHIESSLLAPKEYARLVALHGTTTVIADPHEIANVAGTRGLEFMLGEREGALVDIRYMLPSCVPATPLDVGGATLDARDLARFAGRDGVLGLGEMMNFPGVLAGDAEVAGKLALFPVRDGHAPFLTGRDLNAYILAGPDSDHECTNRAEAEEKLKKGMYIFIREGSTEHNIAELIPLVNPATVSRCCFATDDCHADLLLHDGHIDRCIRKAIACGLAPELAIRMATLSAAERFGLTDRGALTPGRRADFCIIDDPHRFVVQQVFRAAREIPAGPPTKPASLHTRVRCVPPTIRDLQIQGHGMARVIGLVPHQILTESLQYEIRENAVPDRDRDILKVVVCNRYGNNKWGIGLVHGFGFRQGAIACSISHDAHNIVAAGASDAGICSTIEAVIGAGGAMAAVAGPSVVVLPLDCAGLMSTLPYDEVARRLGQLREVTKTMGGIDDPFMYLSFLALTVIPALRITDRGVFDAAEFRDVPLFVDSKENV